MELHLGSCRLQQVPAQLAGRNQLSKLSLHSNYNIQGGWQHLPRHLWKSWTWATAACSRCQHSWRA